MKDEKIDEEFETHTWEELLEDLKESESPINIYLNEDNLRKIVEELDEDIEKLICDACGERIINEGLGGIFLVEGEKYFIHDNIVCLSKFEAEHNRLNIVGNTENL